MSILTELIERLSNDDLKDILKKLLLEANDKDFISMDGTGSDNPVRGSVTMQLGTGFNWFNPSSNYSQYINSFSDYLEISTSNSSTGDITGITYHPRDVFVYSNYAGFKGFRGSDYWGANISSDPATDNNIFPQVGWVREKNALKMDKPVFPYNVNTRVVLADGGTKPLSEIVTDISGKLDKPTVNGSYVVTFLDGVTSYTDASQFGKNISNANLTWVSDRVQDLGTKKLSFINGRFGVPTLELGITSANSVPSKIWTAGSFLWFTDSSGINRKLAFFEDVQPKQVKYSANANINLSTTKTDDGGTFYNKMVQFHQGVNIILYLSSAVETDFVMVGTKFGAGSIQVQNSGTTTFKMMDETSFSEGGVGCRFLLMRQIGTDNFLLYVQNYD